MEADPLLETVDGQAPSFQHSLNTILARKMQSPNGDERGARVIQHQCDLIGPRAVPLDQQGLIDTLAHLTHGSQANPFNRDDITVKPRVDQQLELFRAVVKIVQGPLQVGKLTFLGKAGEQLNLLIQRLQPADRHTRRCGLRSEDGVNARGRIVASATQRRCGQGQRR